MLRDMLERRIEYAQTDGERFFDAAQNARLVADAERYYRAMYYGVGGVVEPARHAHVRHAAVPPCLLRPGVEGDRLGAQLARRRRERHRDERAR